MFQRLLVSLLAALVVAPVHAQQIGVYGTLYDIQEEDAVHYIKRRLYELDQQGEIKRRQQEALARVRNHILHPAPVPGIETAKERRVFYWDPTYTVPQDITDGHGHVVYPAGYKYNPLQYGGLSKRLLFIDERDPKQVAMVKREKKTHPRDEVILTGGSFVDLSKELHEQVFYDQAGFLTKKFGIKHVPAMVEQTGLKMRIEEGYL